jgi:hypothetical protein
MLGDEDVALPCVGNTNSSKITSLEIYTRLELGLRHL